MAQPLTYSQSASSADYLNISLSHTHTDTVETRRKNNVKGATFDSRSKFAPHSHHDAKRNFHSLKNSPSTKQQWQQLRRHVRLFGSAIFDPLICVHITTRKTGIDITLLTSFPDTIDVKRFYDIAFYIYDVFVVFRHHFTRPNDILNTS